MRAQQKSRPKSPPNRGGAALWALWRRRVAGVLAVPLQPTARLYGSPTVPPRRLLGRVGARHVVDPPWQAVFAFPWERQSPDWRLRPPSAKLKSFAFFPVGEIISQIHRGLCPRFRWLSQPHGASDDRSALSSVELVFALLGFLHIFVRGAARSSPKLRTRIAIHFAPF